MKSVLVCHLADLQNPIWEQAYSRAPQLRSAVLGSLLFDASVWKPLFDSICLTVPPGTLIAEELAQILGTQALSPPGLRYNGHEANGSQAGIHFEIIPSNGMSDARAIDQSLRAQGYTHVYQIRHSQPAIAHSRIEEMLKALDHHVWAIGPAPRGKIYALASREVLPTALDQARDQSPSRIIHSQPLRWCTEFEQSDVAEAMWGFDSQGTFLAASSLIETDLDLETLETELAYQPQVRQRVRKALMQVYRLSFIIVPHLIRGNGFQTTQESIQRVQPQAEIIDATSAPFASQLSQALENAHGDFLVCLPAGSQWTVAAQHALERGFSKTDALGLQFGLRIQIPHGPTFRVEHPLILGIALKRAALRHIGPPKAQLGSQREWILRLQSSPWVISANATIDLAVDWNVLKSQKNALSHTLGLGIESLIEVFTPSPFQKLFRSSRRRVESAALAALRDLFPLD